MKSESSRLERRIEVVDEIDRLRSENTDRRLPTVLAGGFTLFGIKAVESASWLAGAGSVILFALFLAAMMGPIRRFARIHDLRAELSKLDRSPGRGRVSPKAEP